MRAHDFVLCGMARVPIGGTKVQQDIEDERKVEQCEVATKAFRTHTVLNLRFHHKQIERLDQQVEAYQQNEIRYKSPVQTGRKGIEWLTSVCDPVPWSCEPGMVEGEGTLGLLQTGLQNTQVHT